MKTKFTTGPWVVNNGSESRFLQSKITTKSKGCDVVICDTPSPYFGEDVSRANAHLIACAPDMYEMLESACSELYGLINEVNKERLSKVHSQTETPPDLHDMETCHLIQQLLKRARGE